MINSFWHGEHRAVSAIIFFLSISSFSSNSFINKAWAFNVKCSTKSNIQINHGSSIHSHSKFLHSTKFNQNRPISPMVLQMSADTKNELKNEIGSIWSPQLRRIMGTISTIGMLETAYLTILKFTSSEPAFCSLQGSCGDVLNGPYATVGDIPLSAFGFMAYASVTVLSLYPILTNTNNSAADDAFNRFSLVFITTSMATFSSFLLSLLFSILHESCIYCYLSAALSIGLSLIVWFGGAVEENKTNAQSKTWPIAQSGISSAVATVLASLAFYASIDNVSTLSASAAVDPNMPPGGYPPPTITTQSSPESLKLAQQLNSLNAKMYGAYWCSHCYDQKQTLGKQSMSIIPYVECAKEGKNSQTDLCKEKDVPGYPTWIINDKLYPGEQTIEELEEIVTKSSSTMK